MTHTEFTVSLVVADGSHKGREIPLPRLPFLIGRGPECGLRPSSPQVGERHCILSARGDRLFLEDLNTPLGTILNGQPLKGQADVGDGDEIAIGPLRFVLRVKEVASKRTPGASDTATHARLIEDTAVDQPGVAVPAPKEETPARSPSPRKASKEGK